MEVIHLYLSEFVIVNFIRKLKIMWWMNKFAKNNKFTFKICVIKWAQIPLSQKNSPKKLPFSSRKVIMLVKVLKVIL